MTRTVPEAALRTFASNLEAYCKVCLKIRTKGGRNPETGQIEAPETKELAFNESQRLVHEMLADQYKRTGRIRAIILKARQQGMSTYTAARFFRKLHLWPNHQAVVIADELDRAQTLYGMYDRFAMHLPEEMRPMMRYVSKQKEMVFDNPRDALRAQNPGLGSGIGVETAGDVHAGRGSTIQLAHLSELSAWPNALEVFLSLIQAVPDYGSEVIVESTANGIGNLFHQMWVQAEEGEGVTEGSNGYLAIFLPWWWSKEYQVPVDKQTKKMLQETLDDYEKRAMNEGFSFHGEVYKLSFEQIAWRRQTIREKAHGDQRLFEQEYPATPEEAFLASGAAFFDEESVRKYSVAAKPPKRRAMLTPGPNKGILVRPATLGYLQIWNYPGEEDVPDAQLKSRYIIGADTAQGRLVAAHQGLATDPFSEKGGRDFSSADVIDVVRRKVVASLHGRMAPEVFAEQLYLLGHLYSGEERTGLRRPALLAVERNHSSGETVIRHLKDTYRYPNLYYNHTLGKRFEKRGDKAGWLTSVETRQPMLDNLAALVREGPDVFPIPNKGTVGELATFVRGEDGKPQAQEGSHDDRVISLAIATFLMDRLTWTPPKNLDHRDLVEVGSSATGMYDY